VRSRAVLLGLGVAMTASGWTALPAAAVPQVVPRSGSYIGHEADKPSPVPVSFVVSKNHKRIRSFTAEAEAKAGCTNHLTGFEAPTGPMAIGAAGRFTRTSTNYPQAGVRVTVTGRFTSARTVTGHIRIRFATIKGCNANRVFTAHRTSAGSAAGST
jgi:hypothetical protein